MKNTDSQPIIIFDFGNVLIDLDYSKAIASFNELLKTDWNLTDQLPHKLVEWINVFESGMLAEESFLWKFQHNFDTNLDPINIISAWNSLLVGMPSERFPFLLELRKKYKTYLLSNTNSLHISWIRNYLKNEHQVMNWETDYFEKVFYSHEILCRKPERLIYKYVMQQIEGKASDIIFIDDVEENIIAANAAGWYGVLHKPSYRIEDKLDGYIASWTENRKNLG